MIKSEKKQYSEQRAIITVCVVCRLVVAKLLNAKAFSTIK